MNNLSENNLSQQHNTKSLEEQETELTKQVLKDLSRKEQEIQNAFLASILGQQDDIPQKKRIETQIEEQKINFSPRQKPPQKPLDQNHIDDEENRALQQTIYESLKNPTPEQQEIEEAIALSLSMYEQQQLEQNQIEEKNKQFSFVGNLEIERSRSKSKDKGI